MGTLVGRLETIAIRSENDIAQVQMRVSHHGRKARLGTFALTKLVTAASELARNVFAYAGEGAADIESVDANGRKGLKVVFIDRGPGIANVDKAMQDGFTTGNGLGLGLPGARRLVDDFVIESQPGQGTRVTITVWTR